LPLARRVVPALARTLALAVAGIFHASQQRNAQERCLKTEIAGGGPGDDHILMIFAYDRDMSA
jgi:hypothetical protein